MHGGRARGLPGGLYLARGFSGQWSREYALRAEVLLMAGSSSTVGVFLRVILSVPGRRTQARIPATSRRATALQRVFPRASDLRGACLRMSMGVWRNGSASGFRAAGWEFASLCPHIAEMGTRLCVCVIPAKCVCITQHANIAESDRSTLPYPRLPPRAPAPTHLGGAGLRAQEGCSGN